MWAEVMENKAGMGGGSGLLATQTIPRGDVRAGTLSVLPSSGNLTKCPRPCPVLPTGLLLTGSQPLPALPSLVPRGTSRYRFFLALP